MVYQDCLLEVNEGLEEIYITNIDEQGNALALTFDYEELSAIIVEEIGGNVTAITFRDLENEDDITTCFLKEDWAEDEFRKYLFSKISKKA